MNVQRGLVGGGAVSLVCAATVASRSADPLPTFAYVLVFALACTALAVALVAAFNRPPRQPAGS
jgi:cobalamin synthase